MRSKLFVPGSRPEIFPKALGSAADALSFDLEDAVVEARKAEARGAVASYLATPELRATPKMIIVRINGRDTPHFEADISALGNVRLDYINLPKVESPEDIVALAAQLDRLEQAAAGKIYIRILATIESPRGLRRAGDIATAHPRLAGLQLGFGDLLGPLGISRSDFAAAHQIRLQLRLAAGEGGAFAYDSAFPVVADAEGFRREAIEARDLGYWGKSCIHPSQVSLANEIFRPSATEVAAARRVVAAADAAEAAGSGAILVDGSMVDRPYAERARRIVAQADATPEARS